MKSRREFLAATTALSANLLARNLHANSLSQLHTPVAPGPPTVRATVAVSATRARRVPANFTGLSYELRQCADTDFFAPSNRQLIAHFRALSPAGVLRLGGNTSSFAWWQPTPSTPQPPHTQRPNVDAYDPAAHPSYPLTPAAITNLRRFLDATGWSCIYGLNLANAAPAVIADEAAFVAATLGPRLDYFQLGNEPDLYARELRDADAWSPAAYFAEWLALARAILVRVPAARFGAPDVARHAEWLTAFAAALAAEPNAPPVAALTHHYYPAGPPTSARVTIPFLLDSSSSHANPRIDADAALALAAAAQIHAACRMTEGNSCYGGGKPGVSDVFASALWAADYALRLASAGYAGLNLHGGSPTDALRPDYTPIAHLHGQYVAEPVFYGLLFAQQFAGATLLDLAFDAAYTPVGATASIQANASAYAALRPDGKTLLAIINKDITNDLVLHVTGVSVSSILRLAAPAPAAREATFARAAVTSTGQWTPLPESAIIFNGHNLPLRIPKASAALLISR